MKTPYASNSNCSYYALRAVVMTDAELDDAINLIWIKRKLHEIGVPRRKIIEFLYDLIRDYPGEFTDVLGNIIGLDTDVFENTPNIDTWFRDFADITDEAEIQTLSPKARERARILGTIFRAYSAIPDLWNLIKAKPDDFKRWAKSQGWKF